MIIGRESELNTLDKIYKKNKFECVIMYGRRRVGKTTIINEFVKNKKNIFKPVYTVMEIYLEI